MSEVHLYVDFKGDESYTPSKVSIRAGSAVHDLRVRPRWTLAVTCNTSRPQPGSTAVQVIYYYILRRLRTGCPPVQEVRVVDLEEPCGCIRIPLGEEPGEESSTAGADQPIRAFFIQVL